jgi:hypothetical protein
LAWFLLFVIGVGSWIIQLAAMFGEWIDYANVRKAKYIPFSTIQYKDKQRKNTVIPSIAALVSGVFMSVAASFLFEGIVESNDRHINLSSSVLFMLAGAGIFLIILTFVRGGSGDASELARDPLSIRAAAEAFKVSNGSAGVNPSTLDENARKWREDIVSHTMNVRKKSRSFKRKKSLRRLAYRLFRSSREARSFQIWTYCLIFLEAIVLYPLSFFLFYVHILLSAAGAVSFVIVLFGDYSVPLTWAIIIAGLGCLVNVLTMLFYGAFRGGRAVRWHSIYVEELMAAHAAIREASVRVSSKITDRQMLENITERLESISQYVEAANFRLL